MPSPNKSRNLSIGRAIFITLSILLTGLSLFLGFSPLVISIFAISPLLFLLGIEAWAHHSKSRTNTEDVTQYGITSDGMNASGQLRLSAPSERLPEIITAATHGIGSFMITAGDAHRARIETGMSMRSAGIIIDLTFEPVEPGTESQPMVVIKAESKPRVKTAISDFGQGKRDIALLFARIEDAHAHRTP